MLNYKIIYLSCQILLQNEFMLTLTTTTIWLLDFPIREESMGLSDFSPCCLRECGWIGVACARDQVPVFQGFEEVFRTLTTQRL